MKREKKLIIRKDRMIIWGSIIIAAIALLLTIIFSWTVEASETIVVDTDYVNCILPQII